MPELGNLKSIDLRQIWPREDEEFTPWLFKEENLTRLADVLNMKLTPFKKEMEVGQFYADIVCRNTVDNSLVVIENQLGETDHDHLGKVLTYAAELHAFTVIWIAAEFTNEHRNTFDWLNENMDERFQFFAVKLELIQIDDSRPAPKFTIIAKPKNWISPIIEGDWRERFWYKFREYLTEEMNSPIAANSFPSNNPFYLGFDIGVPTDQIWTAAWLDPKQRQIAANLHLSGVAKEHFSMLKAHLDNHQSEFDGEFKWWKSSRNVPYRLGFYNNADWMNQEDWRDQFEWLRLNLESLDEVFQSRVANL